MQTQMLPGMSYVGQLLASLSLSFIGIIWGYIGIYIYIEGLGFMV